MRWLIFLCASLAWGAAGDITAVRIEKDACAVALGTGLRCNGAVAAIDISQGGGATPGTGGTYSLGIGAGNDPTSAKIVFTVTSQGYTAAAGATTTTRTVYGTYQYRKPYPNNASMDEAVAGGTLTVRVALSDFIYASDTATVTITAPGGVGFYSQGGTQAGSVTNLAVTNNSTQAYPTSVCRWASPVQYESVAGTFKLEAVCFNRFARNGSPLAVVVFTVTDEHSNSRTYNQITMTVSSKAATYGDQYAVLVYAVDVDTSPFTQGDKLTCNFVAYPWVGDAGAVLTSNTVGVTQPNERLSDLQLLNDKAGTYSGACAVVNVSGGGRSDNNTAQVYSSCAAAEAAYGSSAANSYTAIGYALDAVKGYNNANKGHNDPGGGKVLIVGTHTFTGTGRYAASGAMKTWVTITRLSTVAKASAIYIGSAAFNFRTLRIKFEDVTIGNGGGADGIITDDYTTSNALWLHNTTLNNTFDGSILGFAVAYATANAVTALRDAFAPTASTRCPFALVRGNVFPNATTPSGTRNADLYAVLGNKNVKPRPRVAGGISGVYQSENSIVAFNGTFGLVGPWATAAVANTGTTATSNVAVIQNVAETKDGSGGEPQLVVAADTSTENPVNNVLIWHNNFVGQRTNLAYNDGNPSGGNSGGGPLYRWSWSIRGNNFDDINVVTDIDTHGGYTPDAARTGNHAVYHGTGLSGNCYYNRSATGAGNSYGPVFAGIRAHVGSNEDPAYTSNASYSGTGVGNGDYHLTAGSPALNMIRSGEAVLPYDLDGIARRNDGTGAAGAYEYPQASSRRRVSVIQ